jgi:hypothetical protein
MMVLGVLAPVADGWFGTLPKRMEYLAQTYRNGNGPLPFAQTGFVKEVGARSVEYLSSFDYKKFHKTPELGGLVVPQMPITPLIIMFYVGMIPGRMHSAFERAPEKPDGTKDYREIRDVVMRDVMSIALFLFGLEIMTAANMRQVQQKGRIFGGVTPQRLQLLDGGSTFWSQHPRLPLQEKIKLLEGKNAYSHQALSTLYHLHNEGNLVQWAAHPINRQGLAPLVGRVQARYAKQAEAHPAVGQAFTHLQRKLHALASAADKVDATLDRGRQAFAHSANEAYYNALDPLREQLFALPFFNRASTAHNVTLAQVTQHLQQAHFGSQQALQTTLGSIHARGNTELANLLQDVAEGKGQGLSERLAAFANNADKRIDKHLLSTLGLKRGSTAFKQEFDHLWESLHALQGQAAVAHGQRHLLEVLQHTEHGNVILNGVKNMFNVSQEAMQYVDELAHEAKTQDLKRWSVWPFAKEALDPKTMLAKEALLMRTPADWLSLVFIVAMLGYFPVWLNETLTNVLFERKHGGHDPAATSVVLPTPAQPSTSTAPLAAMPMASLPMPPAGSTTLAHSVGNTPIAHQTLAKQANPFALPVAQGYASLP